MEIFESLEQEELHMMENYIDSYALLEETRSASIEHILRFWANAKSKYLYDMFGKELILSRNITFKRSPDQLTEEIRKALRNDLTSRMFRDNFMRTVCDPFLNDNNLWNVGEALLRLIDFHFLATNIYSEDTIEIPLPNGKTMKLQKGAKVTKVLGKLVKEFNLPQESFEHFRIMISQILNQKTLHGDLCLSIHPLDYMTMSDNDSDWSSCMSWQESGCYRQGTVEMMNSEMVVVAYLRGSEDMHMTGLFKNYHWNNKKWRQLFIVTPNLITGIKAYPYRSDEITQYVLNWLRSLAISANLGNFETEMREYNIDEPIEMNNKSVTLHTDTRMMYNDFAEHHFGYLNMDIPEGDNNFYYSGESECMCCGDEYDSDYFDNEGMLVCNNCHKTYICCECGDHYDTLDDMYIVDDEYVCSYCFESNCSCDDIHGTDHFNSGLTNIYVGDAKHGRYTHERYATIYYQDLNDADVMKKYFKKLYKVSTARYGTQLVVDYNDLTDKGYFLFNYATPEELAETVRNSDPSYSVNEFDCLGKISASSFERFMELDAWSNNWRPYMAEWTF